MNKYLVCKACKEVATFVDLTVAEKFVAFMASKDEKTQEKVRNYMANMDIRNYYEFYEYHTDVEFSDYTINEIFT